MTLDLAGDGLVNFAVDEATLAGLAGARNSGTLSATGGTVVMTARVANALYMEIGRASCRERV